MAGKDAYLKKRILRDGIISAVILVALGAGGFVLMDYDDNAESQKDNVQGNLDSMHNEFESVRNQLGSSYEVQNYYGVYVQNHNSDFSLNREMVAPLLAAMKEKYHLATLEDTIAPVTEVIPDTSQIKIGTLVKSEIKLTFTALTDSDVYGLIGSLQRDFPGIALMHSLSITRTGELTKNVLVDLNQHKISPLVKGELSFVWLGIRPKMEDNTSAGGVANHAR